MKIQWIYYLIVLFFGIKPTICSSQVITSSEINQNRFQYGFTIKATYEFAFSRQKMQSGFRFATDIGVASDYLAEWLHPSFNLELKLYNSGLGARNREGLKRFVTFDAIGAFTVTGGVENNFRPEKFDDWNKKIVPLMYFADFAQPALQNPYRHSISIGTNIVYCSDFKRRFQRIGFFNATINRFFQFSYYNDGGPGMSQLGLGDAKDRYYTGGGVVSLIYPEKNLVNRLEASYHKFTGYTLNAFEAANKLSMAFMDYKDQEQFFFNKSLLSVSAFGFNGKSIKYSNYNSLTLDGQHYIHWKTNASYHMVPYEPFSAISISNSTTYRAIGIQ